MNYPVVDLASINNITWSNRCGKNIVTLPGTLLCPGTQIDNTVKLNQPINELVTEDRTEETVPERNRS